MYIYFEDYQLCFDLMRNKLRKPRLLHTLYLFGVSSILSEITMMSDVREFKVLVAVDNSELSFQAVKCKDIFCILITI